MIYKNIVSVLYIFKRINLFIREFHNKYKYIIFIIYKNNKKKMDVHKIFFSEQNINYLNKQLVLDILEKTQIKIAEQKEELIHIMMEHVYKNYAKNLEYDYYEQVRELNDKFFEIVIPNILNNMEQYINYKKKIDNDVIEPLPYPSQTTEHINNEMFDYSI